MPSTSRCDRAQPSARPRIVPNILVVDDEVGIRELLREVLQDSGYQVTTASSAAEADRRWRVEHPDLVLLDLSLPDRDGLELIKSWVVHNRLPSPVVMLSGHASIDSAVEATRLGASDFLEKPIALQRLLLAVRRALANVAMHGAPEPRVAGSAPPLQQPHPDAASWPAAAFILPFREARAEFERAYFLHLLALEGGNMSRVSERSGLERTHLYRKFRSLGLRAGLAA